MTKEEISNILHLPFPKLAELCKDPAFLAQVISVAYNEGMRLGKLQTNNGYNQMFKGYSKVTIEN